MIKKYWEVRWINEKFVLVKTDDIGFYSKEEAISKHIERCKDMIETAEDELNYYNHQLTWWKNHLEEAQKL